MTGSAAAETKRAGLTTAHATRHRDSGLQVAIYFRGRYIYFPSWPGGKMKKKKEKKGDSQINNYLLKNTYQELCILYHPFCFPPAGRKRGQKIKYVVKVGGRK